VNDSTKRQEVIELLGRLAAASVSVERSELLADAASAIQRGVRIDVNSGVADWEAHYLIPVVLFDHDVPDPLDFSDEDLEDDLFWDEAGCDGCPYVSACNPTAPYC
jgi:hypothetical protein